LAHPVEVNKLITQYNKKQYRIRMTTYTAGVETEKQKQSQIIT